MDVFVPNEQARDEVYGMLVIIKLFFFVQKIRILTYSVILRP